MHELALCQAIADTVIDRSEGRTVHRVQIRVGHLRQVVPPAMHFSWDVVVDDTELAGCALDIEQVPAVVRCRACSADTTLEWPILVCEHCTSLDVELVSGEEFQISSIDVTEGAH